jgi:hypothetical protein
VARCTDCGLSYFEDRYDEAEVAALYERYRGEQYFQQRHHLEPWYSRSFNAQLGEESATAGGREMFQGLLSRFQSVPIRTVLDFGGDRGQLMVGGLGEEHYVFDISGVEAAPGVIRILDPVELAGRTFDLVLLYDVMEHLSQPVEIVRDEVAPLVAPGGFLFVKVPRYDFQFSDIPTGSWYATYLNWLLRSRVATTALDFWSTAVRTKFARIPPLGFAKMHEHINFFDVNSLSLALGRSGLDLLACEPHGDGHTLIALLQRGTRTSPT